VAEVDDHIGVAMSGLTADARTLVEHARVETQARRRPMRAHTLLHCAAGLRRRAAHAATPLQLQRADVGGELHPGAVRPGATLWRERRRRGGGRRHGARSARKLPASDAAPAPALTPARAPQSRPFGVALLIAGWDAGADGGAVLYQTDPSGTFAEFSAKAIGSGSEGAQTALQARAGVATPRAARVQGATPDRCGARRRATGRT